MTKITNTWDKITKGLHWLVALLIFTVAILGFVAASQDMSPAKIQLFVWHKSIGITILALMLLRLIWRFTGAQVTETAGLTDREQRLAKIGHAALYGIVILMASSGWLLNSAANFPFKWFGLVSVPSIYPTDEGVQELASNAHFMLFVTLAVLVTGHIAMAFKHQLAGITVLNQMLPARWTAAAVLCTLAIAVLGLVSLAWFDSHGKASAPALAGGAQDVSAPGETGLNAFVDSGSTNWQMLESDSSLSFVMVYAGVATEGYISRFDPSIAFDPERLDTSQVDVSIDITSLSTGSPDMDPFVADPEWLDFSRHPGARFSTEEFIQTDNGDYIAYGALDLKGVSRPVEFRFSWQEAPDDTVRVLGEATINRVDFNVGSGEWAEDDTIGYEIIVKADLTLLKQYVE